MKIGVERLSIIIPAYNERRTIAELLDRVCAVSLENIEKEIIVVESQSTDGTRDVVRAFETAGKIRAIFQDLARGKGHAVKAGLAMATGTLVLIQDADLEYDIQDYPKLLAPLLQGTATFVLGSRHLGLQSREYRTHVVGRWLSLFMNNGVWVFTEMFNLLYGQHLTDPCTMYKVFRREGLQGIHLVSEGFDLDWEILAKLIRNGQVPIELGVAYRSRSWKDGKKIRLWRDGWASLRAIWRFRFGPL